MTTTGNLQGRLGRANWKGVWGWALDADSHADKVAVEILLNDVLVGRVVADELRPNMKHLRPEQQACGFQFPFPNGLSALSRHVVRARFADTGAELQDSPAVVEPGPGLDPALEQTIGTALQVAAGQARSQSELDAPLEFVVGQIQHLLEARRQLAGDSEAGLPAELASLSARWGELLHDRPDMVPASGAAGSAGARRRILVIGDAAPALDDSVRVLLAHMASLTRLGASVEFVPAEPLAAAAQIAAIEALGVLHHRPGLSPSVEDALRRNRGLYDTVLLHRIGNAEQYAAMARRYCPLARIVYSVDNLHFVRMLRRAALQGWSAGAMRGEALRLREMMAAWSANAVMTGSVFEADLLRRGVPQAQVHVVPWPVAIPEPPADFAERDGIGFIGDFRTHEDYDAAAWLIEVLMPQVWSIDPGIRCVVAGCRMPEPLRSLTRDGISVLEQPPGAVADMAPALAGVRLGVAPYRAGAGTGPAASVLACLAAGLPCAGTSTGFEALDLPQAARALVADDARSLAAMICRLHGDAEANAELAALGRRFVAETFNAAETDRRMLAVIGTHPTREAAPQPAGPAAHAPE